MRFLAALFPVVFLLNGSCPVTAQNAAAADKTASVPRVHQILLEEQSEKQPTSPKMAAEVAKRSGLRRQEIRKIMASGDLKTGEDFHDAAYLFQHGDQANDYLLAHILAIQSILRGDTRSKWLAAATLDRYLQMIQQPQIFGTQYPRDPDAWEKEWKLYRNSFRGRTQSPFDATFMPDAVRLEFCVPPLSQQKKNLESLNSGTYPSPTMVAPGCTR